jgi:glycosyltransferase involved in cell wall biosynthesis
MDLVSVYIPTYNRLELLKRAINSVLVQSYEAIEIIVVDDGSDDGTREYLCSIGNSTSNVRVLEKKGVPRGAQFSRNMALEAAKGRFVTGLDDDDYFHPERVRLLTSSYRENCSAIASNFYKVGISGVSSNSFVPRLIHSASLYTSNSVGNQVLTERNRILEVGAYDTRLSASQDVDLWIRLIDRFGPIKRLSSRLYFFDVSHQCARISTSTKRAQGTFEFLEKYSHAMTAEQYEYRKSSIFRSSGDGLTNQAKSLFKFGASVAIERLRGKLKLG